jgi:hypothetical protein
VFFTKKNQLVKVRVNQLKYKLPTMEGGVGVEETVVGVGGGAIEGVSGLTSSRDFAGSVSRHVAVAA